MNTFKIDDKRIKKICNLIDSFLQYPFDIDVLKAYCLGFVMAISIFSDIDMENSLQLNKYIDIKVDTIKMKSREIH